MKQCKTCMNREYKDKLCCCAAAEVLHAFHELFKQFPLFGKYVKTFECGNYMADKKLTGFPDMRKYSIEAVQQELRKLDVRSRQRKRGIEEL